MEELKAIKSSINDKINELREKIKKIYDKQKAYKEEKDFIDRLLEGEDFSSNRQFSNRKKTKIIEINPSMEDEFTKYEILVGYTDLLSLSNFDKIDYEILSDLSQPFCPTIHKEQIIRDIEFCKNMVDVVKDKSFKDEAVLRRYEQIRQSLINRMTAIIRDYSNLIHKKIKKDFEEKYSSLEEELKSIEVLKQQQEELRRMDIFGDDGSIVRFFENKEELNKFYDWIHNNVDVPLQLKVIPLITKQGLLITQKEREKEVTKNRESIMQGLQQGAFEEEKIDLSSLDLSSYTEEEKQIVIDGLKVYAELRMIETDRNDIITENDKDNKEFIYLLDDIYHWDIILYDIEHNLLPNVNSDKENVLNSFKTINSIYKKYKEETDKRFLILNEIIGELEQYQELVSFVGRYGTSQYDYVIENGIKESSSSYPKSVPYEQILMSYYVNHEIKKEIEELTRIKEQIELRIRNKEVMLEENDGIDLSVLEDRFDSIYETGSDKINIYKEILQGTYVKREEQDDSLESTTNLIFCICDSQENDDKDYQEDYKKACELLEHRKHWTIADKVHELWKKSSTGKKQKYNIPNVKMKRIRALGDSRIGLAIFDVSEEIMKILKDRYKLGDDARVYGLFNAVTPGANHKTYSDIQRSVSHNTKYISLIAQMLNGKNVNFEKLFEVIDLGIERRDTILNDSDEVKKYE